MKRINKNALKIAALALALAALLAVCAACSVRIEDKEKNEKDRPYVICTIFPQYDFLRNIVGDTMKLELLVPPGVETHAYGLANVSATHLVEILDADMIVSVGGESDEKLMGEMKKHMSNHNADVRYVEIIDFISEKLAEDGTVGITIVDGEEEEHDHEDEEGEEGECDEHVWTSPRRAIEIVDGLTDAVCALSPDRAESYRANAADYKAKLKGLDAKLTELTEKKTFDTLVFADRFPFRYLCYDYGISAHAAFRGCSTSVEPSMAVLEKLYDTAHELALPAILYMEGSKPIYAQDLAAQTGAQALMLHSCHIISEKEFESESYLSLMEKNIGVLKIALGVGD